VKVLNLISGFSRSQQRSSEVVSQSLLRSSEDQVRDINGDGAFVNTADRPPMSGVPEGHSAICFGGRVGLEGFGV